MRQRGALLWLGLFVVAVLVGFVARPGRTDGVRLDPQSTAPDGTRALTELLDRFDADVALGGFDDSTDTIIVLDDFLGTSDTERIEAWVNGGGLLIWADNDSTFGPLQPQAATVASNDEASVELGICSIPALADLQRLIGPDLRRYSTASASAVCFADSEAGIDGTAGVAEFRIGQGRVVAIPGASLLENEFLAEADNAAMIVRLATADGRRSVAVLHTSTATSVGVIGDDELSLFDLIPERVNVLLLQLPVAAGLWLWYRGRRFGKVVTEQQLVEIPASLLVRSTAELQRRAGGGDWAINALRSDFVDRLRAEHRLPATTDHPNDAAMLFDTVARRTGYPAHRLEAIARPGAIAELSELAAAIDDASSHVLVQPTAVPASVSSLPGSPHR